MTFVNIDPHSTASALHEPSGALRLLAANGLLAGLPRHVLEALAQHAQERRYAVGATLFHEGDPARHCLLVDTGAVEVLRYDNDGEERMLRRFMPGELVAEAAMFMPHGRYPMTARASAATRVWHLPRTAWHAVCTSHPALGLCLLQALTQRLYLRINEVDWLSASKPPQRLAAYLLAQANAGSECVDLPTSQRQLATQLGIRPETLSRLLAQWQNRGWIAGERRCWRLCNPAALHRLTASSVRSF